MYITRSVHPPGQLAVWQIAESLFKLNDEVDHLTLMQTLHVHALTHVSPRVPDCTVWHNF
jgi:hypothetical protein